MKVWEFLWKIVGQLIIILGIVGIITIANWMSGIYVTMPEEALFYVIPFGGYITCGIVIIIGIITLGGWFWNRHPTIIILYTLSFLIGLASIVGCYMTNNDNAFKIVLSILGMVIVILTTLTILTKKYSATNTGKPRKIAVISSVVIIYLILMLGFIFPQCFDAVARSFPDPILREAVRNEIGKPFGFITQSDLEHMANLMIWGNDKPLTRLEGMEKCTGLKWLALGGNFNQVDITPLSNLPNLEYLQISFYYSLGDITLLSNLSQLTELKLHYNAITDISPISNLVNLNMLNISSNSIEDISPLSNLVNLSRLDISSNSISDISPLLDNTGLSAGDEIYLNNNPLDNYSANIVIPELISRGVSVYR